MNQLSIGILTWHRPATLSYALKSYARAGLLKNAGEVTLFANAANPREVALARIQGLRVIESVDNVGIGPAFAALAGAATRPYFLFLGKRLALY